MIFLMPMMARHSISGFCVPNFIRNPICGLAYNKQVMDTESYVFLCHF
jgi:hypothetical protein